MALLLLLAWLFQRSATSVAEAKRQAEEDAARRARREAQLVTHKRGPFGAPQQASVGVEASAVDGLPHNCRATAGIAGQARIGGQSPCVIRHDARVIRRGARVIQRDACAIRHDACVIRRGARVIRRDACAIRRDACAIRRDACAIRRDACAIRRDACVIRLDARAIRRDSRVIHHDACVIRRDACVARRGQKPRQGPPAKPRSAPDRGQPANGPSPSAS